MVRDAKEIQHQREFKEMYVTVKEINRHAMMTTTTTAATTTTTTITTTTTTTTPQFINQQTQQLGTKPA
jgi:hypothetical protein